MEVSKFSMVENSSTRFMAMRAGRCQAANMPNRLAHATSPYLQQHADNPVDWWTWCPEAFTRAQERDVPVLLSIGYATCHWCHVMAHESFEDVATATQVNAGFLPIKVDREERPDIDAVYLAATQAMSGAAGWPMTCFLTPSGEPFHCGTYYPPSARQGKPGFRQLLTAVSRAWRDDGDRLRHTAGQLSARVAGAAAAALPPSELGEDALSAAVAALSAEFDERWAGFGASPKFPPSMVLEFLLRHYQRTGAPRALEMVERTCEVMARGGAYDQLGGGFARYCVDARWVVPHFEKMLYDNAQLIRVYAHLARRTDSPTAQRVAEETVAFLLRELRTTEGGFASALDADTDGVEGLAYTWTPSELRAVLGEGDGRWAAALLEVTDAGTFEHGRSTPQLLTDPDDVTRWARVRAMLRAARDKRPQPGRDDKVITAWNGLAIAALAEAGAAAGRGDWIDAAADAASLVLNLHLVDGRLRRSSRRGVAGSAPGVLEDYGCLAEGLLALHQATGHACWLGAAISLLDTALVHFAAGVDEPGRFFDTADDAETLLHRPRDLADGATPSGAAALAGAMLTASVLAPPACAARFGEASSAAVVAAGSAAVRHPRFAGHWLGIAEAATHGPLQVALVGPVGDAQRSMLDVVARKNAPGGAVVVAGESDAPGVPLLAGRPLVAGAAAAYVCKGFVCHRPATTQEELVAALR